MRFAKTAATLAAVLLLLGVPGHGSPDPGALDLREEIERFVEQRSRPHARVFVPPVDALVPVPAPPLLEVDLSASEREEFVGLVPVNVVLREGDRSLLRAVVTVKVEPLRPVVVAARPLRSGHLIDAGDLRLEPRLADALPPGASTEPGDLIGRRVRRSVRGGSPITRAQVEEPPAVLRGQRVTLRLQRGSMRIEAMGRAREDGRVGQPIRVQNLSSRRDVLGTVDLDGVVHVVF